MAANRPILTAGDALKKEKVLTGSAIPATFASASGAGVETAAADYVEQVAVFDYTGANGVDFDHTAYAEGDQVPVLYPTNGCEINVALDPASGAVTAGDYLGAGAGGKAVKVVDVTTALGVALENAAAGAGGKILMEVRAGGKIIVEVGE
jgi:hypothetical protein